MFIIEDSEPHHREGSEENIEELEDPLVVISLPRERRREAEPELRQRRHHVLIETVAHQQRIATVALPPVVEQNPLQILKLADCIVASSGRLRTFQA